MVDTDDVRVTVNYVDLLAFRPQTPPFVNADPIPFAEEETPGVFIRRNRDDDNNNQLPDWTEMNVANENDLIRVRLDTSVASTGVEWVLEKGAMDIRIWTSATKTSELLPGQLQGVITFPGGAPADIWVEWAIPGTGPAQATLDFRMRDAVSGNAVHTDTLVFHPFQSIVIALGGEGQTPADPSVDGMFQTAINLYRLGYDVYMY